VRRKALVVARWPLGGIRTYMRFVYESLCQSYDITILAADTQEMEALREDVRAIGAELVVSARKPDLLFMDVYAQLKKGRFDIIQSQGFISAFHVTLGNRMFRVPHVLTVHGVLEDRLIVGISGHIKSLLVKRAILSADVIYAVSHDILEHLTGRVPAVGRPDRRKQVILNGIDTRCFSGNGHGRGGFRERFGIDEHAFAIGFVGRLMPQKGFPSLVQALVSIEGRIVDADYQVLVVGSGDYRDWYVRMVEENGLSERVAFVPFQEDMASVYQGLDMIVMPSEWEACPLQPMEALCMGLPVLASDCIGLREVVRNTPARTFPQGDADALALALKEMIETRDRKPFLDFRGEAASRFDARQTADRVKELFDETCV